MFVVQTQSSREAVIYSVTEADVKTIGEFTAMHGLVLIDFEKGLDSNLPESLRGMRFFYYQDSNRLTDNRGLDTEVLPNRYSWEEYSTLWGLIGLYNSSKNTKV